jgi:transcriptional antiterminator RfaH
MRAWYLAYCKARQEATAATNLARQGYEIYLPLLRRRVRRQRQFVNVVGPMFPRYLFIHLDDQTDNWKPIRSTIGVSRLVRFGDLPAQVPDVLIDALRQREGADGVHEADTSRLMRGDRVRIVDGALAGYEAIFEARTSRERVALLLDIAGRPVPVQLRESDIEPLV